MAEVGLISPARQKQRESDLGFWTRGVRYGKVIGNKWGTQGLFSNIYHADLSSAFFGKFLSLWQELLGLTLPAIGEGDISTN